MKEAEKQKAKQILKIQTKRNKKKHFTHKLGLCSSRFPKDSFYYKKTHTILQWRWELQKNGPGAPFLIKENSMFDYHEIYGTV